VKPLETKISGDRTVRYSRTGQGQPLLFLQGFGIKTTHYRPLFEALAGSFEIFAPDLLRSNRFRGQPVEVDSWAGVIEEFVQSVGLADFGVVGHSLGGAVSYTLAARSDAVRWAVGLNPLLPPSCGPGRLIGRSLRKGASESIGREGLKALLFANKFHGSFLYHTLRDLKNTAQLASNVCRFDYTDLRVTQPSAMIWGERDEYFRLTPFVERQIELAFDDIRIERLPELNHDWPVYRPEHAVQAILAMHTQAP